MTNHHVLVTGGSGFIAGHCILQLLAQGHQVRATLRSLDREPRVRADLTAAGMVHGERLSFVAADLTDDAGWAAAMSDIEHVLHVASPVQPGHVATPDDLITPAREGTLRVLRAARDAGVRRVVLTSAFHAVAWGHPREARVFTEADWTVIDGPGVDPYTVSKTLAERAAWQFVADEGGPLELVTMLPVAVMGPVLGRDASGSNALIRRILAGDMPGYPNLYFPVVDVRDVATAHVMAMTADGAAGQRFLLCSGPAISLSAMGAAIRAELGAAADRVPQRTLPDVAVRIGALFSRELRTFAPELGYVRVPSNAQARRVLGWQPRPEREAIVAAADSMLAAGLIATR